MSEPRDASWDYGLEPGESFEPEGWEDEPFDLSQPYVMTALGPIDPGALGFTLHGQRLLANPPKAGVSDLDGELDDLAKAASELEGYAVTGGQAIVDIGTATTGRTVADLLFVAQRSPVHIVFATGSTGQTRGRFGPSQVMIEEITQGIDDSTVRAGLIVMTDVKSIESIAAAHIETRAPVYVNLTDQGSALQAVRSLVEFGVTPGRITVTAVEGDDISMALQTGCFVLFDQWASGSRDDDQRRACEIATLVESGFEQSVLIAGDLARRSRRLSYGGEPGFVYFIDEVPLMLMEAGLQAQAVRSVFIENVAAALTISP